MAELKPIIVFHGRHFVRHLGICNKICIKLIQLMCAVISSCCSRVRPSLTNRLSHWSMTIDLQGSIYMIRSCLFNLVRNWAIGSKFVLLCVYVCLRLWVCLCICVCLCVWFDYEFHINLVIPKIPRFVLLSLLCHYKSKNEGFLNPKALHDHMIFACQSLTSRTGQMWWDWNS